LEYFLHILILIALYATLAMSLDLVVGHCGILSVTQAAFFGLGAYTAAILTTRFNVDLISEMLLAGVIGLIASLLVSIPSVRLQEDYFVIAAFGFQIIISSVLNNWMQLTRGPLGIPGIPRPMIFGVTVGSYVGFLLLSSAVAFLTFAVVTSLEVSAFGRVLRGIREDEVLIESFGKSVFRFKVTVLAISSFFACMVGVIYAHYMTFVDPTSFTIMDSILILSMVAIGGAGSAYGPILGAAILILLPEILRFAGLPVSVAANVRQILYGLALVTVVAVRPNGIIGKYELGR
jgi:branched-chain amino acid transport system permease protein